MRMFFFPATFSETIDETFAEITPYVQGFFRKSIQKFLYNSRLLQGFLQRFSRVFLRIAQDLFRYFLQNSFRFFFSVMVRTFSKDSLSSSRRKYCTIYRRNLSRKTSVNTFRGFFFQKFLQWSSEGYLQDSYLLLFNCFLLFLIYFQKSLKVLPAVFQGIHSDNIPSISLEIPKWMFSRILLVISLPCLEDLLENPQINF